MHLLSSTGYHGAENMVAALVRALARRGVVNHVSAFRNNERSDLRILEETAGQAEGVVAIDCRGRFDPRTAWTLRRYVEKNAIDIVHSHKYKTNLYALLSRATGSRLVSTCHNWRTSSARLRLYAAIDKRVLRGFDAAVAVSGAIEAELRRYIGDRKTHRIDNGVETSRFTRKMDARRELALPYSKVVGYVGRLSEEKATNCLIAAAPAVLAAHPDAGFVIVGDGDQERALKAQTAALGLERSVRFLGHRADTVNLYSAFNVLVLPSLYEGLPLVVLEAMACETPVVATRVGDIPAVIDDGVSGLLVAPGDANALSAAILRVLGDDDYRRTMGLAGALRVRANFSADAMASQYDALYRDLLHNPA